MITHLRNFTPPAIEEIDQPFTGLGFRCRAVYCQINIHTFDLEAVQFVLLFRVGPATLQVKSQSGKREPCVYRRI